MRPTGAKVREAIFDILEARYGIKERTVLDLFAGSGALGLEALSRGASLVIFVDQGRDSCQTVRQNLARSGVAGRAEVRRMRLPIGLARLEPLGPFGGAFLDPPYGKGLSAPVLERLGAGALLEPGAWVVAEHAKKEELLERYGCLRREHRRDYGSTAISLYCRVEGE